VYRPKSVATGILFAYLLSGVAFAASTPSKSNHREAVAAANRLFVANPGVNTVSVYPVGKFGNVPSLVTDSKLTVPSGIARDSAGRIYVANSGGDTITVFAAGASGTPNPNAMIFGSRTGLANPTGIALDSKGNIYVTNLGRNNDASVTVYPRGSNGNVPPPQSSPGLGPASLNLLDSPWIAPGAFTSSIS
jgi:serine/threonine-protein kinase